MERCAVEARRGLRVGREPYSCFSCEGQECVLTTSALRVNWPRRDGAAGKAHPPHRVVTGVAVQARLPRDAEDVAVASHSPLVDTEARWRGCGVRYSRHERDARPRSALERGAW